MREMMEQILTIWKNYWGTGYYQYLLLAAVLYLLIFRRKSKTTKYVLGYLGLILFLFFCPISAKIIRMCIGESVYWRVLWLMQLVPVIALAATEFLKERKKAAQAVLLILFAGAIVVCGKGIYAAGNYKIVHNYQQVPDEVAAIGNLIKTDAGDNKVIVATDNYIGSYLRVYDPSIYMFYGREQRGAVGNGARNMYLEMNAGALNHRKIARYGKMINCNYIIVLITAEQQKDDIKAYGYEEIGMVNQYGVFRLGESAESCRNPLLFRGKADTLDTITDTEE